MSAHSFLGVVKVTSLFNAVFVVWIPYNLAQDGKNDKTNQRITEKIISKLPVTLRELLAFCKTTR